MNLTSPSQVKAWCIEHDFHPNRVLGQNFLIDRNQLLAIVDAGAEGLANMGRPPRVLEIGPGLGVLTEEMLRRGFIVTAIEKDPVLAARLGEALGGPKNLEVVAGDALEVLGGRKGDLSVGESGFDAMISNLPYQAGTRILLDLCESHEIGQMTALVQTEVAERLAAGPGSKTRGLAGVLAQLDYDVSIVRKVAPTCFWPRPEVGSSVVRLVRHHRNDGFSADARRVFRILVKTAFAQRRKQLGKVFKNMVQSTARAEELGNDDWVSLAQQLKGSL